MNATEQYLPLVLFIMLKLKRRGTTIWHQTVDKGQITIVKKNYEAGFWSVSPSSEKIGSDEGGLNARNVRFVIL